MKNEDERVEIVLPRPTILAGGLHVGALLLGGFLSVMPLRQKKRQIVVRPKRALFTSGAVYSADAKCRF